MGSNLNSRNAAIGRERTSEEGVGWIRNGKRSPAMGREAELVQSLVTMEKEWMLREKNRRCTIASSKNTSCWVEFEEKWERVHWSFPAPQQMFTLVRVNDANSSLGRAQKWILGDYICKYMLPRSGWIRLGRYNIISQNICLLILLWRCLCCLLQLWWVSKMLNFFFITKERILWSCCCDRR